MEILFWCSNEGCQNKNESKHGLVKHQVRRRYSCARGTIQRGKTPVPEQSTQLEFKSDPLERLKFQLYHNNCEKNDGNFRGCGENIKEVFSYLVDVVECPLDLCSSSSASNVTTLMSVIHQEKFDMNTLREYVCGGVDGSRITKGASKWWLIENEFEREKITVENDVF